MSYKTVYVINHFEARHCEFGMLMQKYLAILITSSAVYLSLQMITTIILNYLINM